MNRSVQKPRRWAAVLIAGGFLALAAISLFVMTRGTQLLRIRANPQGRIEINNLRPGDVQFFSYRDRAGDEIRFLLARDSTGRVKAAFDACERCYKYHMGYKSSGGDLICRFCGNRYRLEAMESGLASCVPAKLPIQVIGQTVHIKSVDLERRRGLF